MAQDKSSQPVGDFKPASIAFTVLILICLAVTWYQNGLVPQPPVRDADRTADGPTVDSHRRDQQSENRGGSIRVPREDEPLTPELDRDFPDNGATVSTPVANSEYPGRSPENLLRIPHQTIRDQSGHVVFQGTIDLAPTMERIARGESNRHHNDGTTFQNREGRLPRKNSGYYKEYVHPTPGEHGPGPQRVIIGQAGEVWYTPDHYKTFQEIKSR